MRLVIKTISFLVFGWIVRLSVTSLASVPVFQISAADKMQICHLIYQSWFNFAPAVLNATCSKPKLSFYPGIFEEPEYTEFAVIGESKGITQICKVFSRNADQAEGFRVFEVDGCSEHNSGLNCEAAVKTEVAKSLVRKYPTVAHSFSVAEPVLKKSRGADRIYWVTTSDEVESEKWSVTATVFGENCAVRAVRHMSGIKD